MIDVSIKEIIEIAKKLVSEKKKWHFHLLTPDCVFNDRKDYALVFEDTGAGETFVNHSEVKQEAESKALLELLHGIKADEKQKVGDSISLNAKKIAERAKELTAKEISWHHHALFPDCVFNKSKGKWVVMLEDPETGKVLESITAEKPDADLQLIEPLFYHQK